MHKFLLAKAVFLASTSLFAAVTVDSDYGVLIVNSVTILDEDTKFTEISLSGFNDPGNETRILVDDDGFFSILLAIHAYRQEALFFDAKGLSEKALNYLARKIPFYIDAERHPKISPLKTKLTAIIDVTPLNLKKAVELLRALKYAEMEKTGFDDLLSSIKLAEILKGKVSEREWFTKISLIAKEYFGYFEYPMSRVVQEPVFEGLGGHMPGGRVKMQDVVDYDMVRDISFKFEIQD